MPTLEPLQPPESLLDRFSQSKLAWHLSSVARSNRALRYEHPDVAHDFRSPLAAHRKLSVLSQLAHDRKLATDIICTKTRHGLVQGLANAALNPLPTTSNISGRQVELSYWHLPLAPGPARDAGADVVRQAALHAIEFFDLDPYYDSVWMRVNGTDEIKDRVCRDAGLDVVDWDADRDEIIYSRLVGVTAAAPKPPE